MSNRYGTNHFTATRCALAYYRGQGYDAEEVQEKLEDGEIVIGRPQAKPGQSVKIDSDGRYWIEG